MAHTIKSGLLGNNLDRSRAKNLHEVTVPFLLVEIAALMMATYLPKIALFIPHMFGFR